LLSAQNGWREKEMEVRVNILSDDDVAKIEVLHFSGELYSDNQLTLYLIPEELNKLKETGLDYEILINDLNSYYKGYWNNREEYHSYIDIINLADSLAENFPFICKKYLFGTSIQGRELGALKISDHPEIDENEAEIMFDSGIHGDETIGPEIVIRFARHLCLQYNDDPYITNLINEREIWLYYMVNPDGRENMSRYNANGVDCNRDWGYMWDQWGGSPAAYSQIETKTLRSCMLDNQFVVHVTYHSGTEKLG